jgi:lipoate-protein ligase A
MTEIRLLIDPPAAGAWNMAVDETLVESAAERGQGTLRFYAWSEPTLSLGYFQAAADRVLHAASRDCPLVRRASGGGAILHDRELTYSIALPQRGARTPANALYDLFHDTLVVVLRSFGVAAARYDRNATNCRTAANGPASGGGEPFLCFERRTCADIVCGGAKIAGSAQRRHRGAVLQHGSILLRRSPFAPELPGIYELSGNMVLLSDLVAAWQAPLAESLRAALIPGDLLPAERARAAAWSAKRFGDAAYVGRR